MANSNAPFGLRPITSAGGTAPRVHEYKVTVGFNVFEGSLVIAVAGSGNNVIQIVPSPLNATSAQIVGVAAQKRFTTDTDRAILVYDDPNQEYEIQVDSGASPIFDEDADCVFSHFPTINPAAGNTTTGLSSMELDGSGPVDAASDTAVLLCLRRSRDVSVDFTSVNPKVVVRITASRHLFGSSVTGAA